MTTSTTPRPDSALLDETLRNLATDMILAMLSSIPHDKIDPLNHWHWAKKSLEVAAGRARTFDRFVSEMAGQLPIDGALTKRAASSVYLIGQNLNSWGEYPGFRAMCKRDAIYLTLLAQQRAEELKAMREAARAAIDHTGEEE